MRKDGSERRQIVLVSGNHLCHNPRVAKEAAALAGSGLEVTVLGAWTSPALKARDLDLLQGAAFSFLPVLDWTARSLHARLRRLAMRAARRGASWLHRRWGLQDPAMFGSAERALARAGAGLRGDLYIAHSEAALLAARRLAASGRRVGVDMEDWFSEDLLPQARSSRPTALFREAERGLLVGGDFASCPSRAMSESLACEFSCAPPTVIYNAFAWAERRAIDGLRRDRNSGGGPSIHWFSQTLGEGRGLEDLLAALPGLRSQPEIQLRGVPTAGFEDWFMTRVPERMRDRVRFLPLVSNEELLSRISEHDIGFAGEMKYSRSRDLTVSNKILQYLLAGLAVVASDTTGQREVAESAPGAVALYPSGDHAALAARLNDLLESAEALGGAKRAALRAAEAVFCWEKQEPRLLEAASRALARRGR